VGALFKDPKGCADVPKYVFGKDSAVAKKVRKSHALREAARVALTRKAGDILTRCASAVGKEIAVAIPLRGNVPADAPGEEVSQLLRFRAIHRTSDSDTDLAFSLGGLQIDDPRSANGLAVLTSDFRCGKDGHVAIIRSSVFGRLRDLYDFDYDTPPPAPAAAVVQAGFGTLGKGTDGQVFVHEIWLDGEMSPDGLDLDLSVAKTGDLAPLAIGVIDQDDVVIVGSQLGRSVNEASCGPACDFDGDGRITIKDVFKLRLACTRPQCRRLQQE
jgi:hypothetical protein